MPGVSPWAFWDSNRSSCCKSTTYFFFFSLVQKNFFREFMSKNIFIISVVQIIIYKPSLNLENTLGPHKFFQANTASVFDNVTLISGRERLGRDHEESDPGKMHWTSSRTGSDVKWIPQEFPCMCPQEIFHGFLRSKTSARHLQQSHSVCCPATVISHIVFFITVNMFKMF